MLSLSLTLSPSTIVSLNTVSPNTVICQHIRSPYNALSIQHVMIVLNLIKDGYFLLHPEQLPVCLQ